MKNDLIMTKIWYTELDCDYDKKRLNKIQIFNFRAMNGCHIGKHRFWP